MADRERTIAVKVSVKKEGEDVLADMAKDADSFGKRMDQAGTAADKVLAQVEKGGKVSRTAMLELASAVEKYEASMKAAEAVGKTLGDAETAGLAKAKHAYEAGVDAIGKYKANVQALDRATEDAALKAGATAKNINSLDDVIRELSEDLGPAAVKWLSWGTAAVGAFSAGYAAGEKFRKVVNDMTGGELDRLIQKYNPLIAVVNEWGGAVDKSGEAARTANEKHILLAHGIDTAGNSAAQVHAKFAAYTGELQKHAIEVDKADQAYKDWAKDLPLVGKELEKSLNAAAKSTQGFVDTYKKAHKDLSDEDIAKAVGPKIDALVKQMDAAKVAVPADLRAIADEFERQGKVAAAGAEGFHQAAMKIAASGKDFAAALATVIQSGQGITPVLANAAAAVGTFAAPWTLAENNMSLFVKSTVSAQAALGGMNSSLLESAKASDAMMAATRHMQQTLEGLGSQADKTAQQISRVFNGVASGSSTGLPTETGEFGHGLIVTQTDPTVETGGDW